MAYKETEPDDPMELVGVVLPADAEAMRDMAYAFAEEFVRMGYDRRQLLSVFQNPFYAGAHGAYQALGETEILTIIDECINVWGRSKIVTRDRDSCSSRARATSHEHGLKERSDG